jgi:hypothetical protein
MRFNLIHLFCITLLLCSCSSKGPIRWLSVQRDYPYKQYVEPQCRHQHPYHYRSPKWYKHQVLKDNYKPITQWYKRNFNFNINQ